VTGRNGTEDMMFQFDLQKTRALEASIDEIQLDPAQQRLIRDIVAVIGPQIGLDSIPCRGLWLGAVRAWQQEHKRPATIISEMSPPERARAAKEMLGHFVRLATEMLRSPDQATALAKAVEDAWGHYMANYNKRPTDRR
jgi:hypothetical protein